MGRKIEKKRLQLKERKKEIIREEKKWNTNVKKKRKKKERKKERIMEEKKWNTKVKKKNP